MSRVYLGIDTSCYTTSVACYSAEGLIYESRKLLSVAHGQRGLRQSEGLYQHVRQLPDLLESMLKKIPREAVAGIGCSFTPTAEPDSYMPVFLAGSGQARALAAAWNVPLYRLTHQSGHIRAALIGNDELLHRSSFLAIHLSGGTTDLLDVARREDNDFMIHKIGSSLDLHAGQLVDRIGVELGAAFPAGPSLEKMAEKACDRSLRIPSHVIGLDCALSGAENFLISRLDTFAPEELAFALYDFLARTLAKMIGNAQKEYADTPVLLCGGVASSGMLRELLASRIRGRLYFGQNCLSSDNAAGIAALAYDKGEVSYEGC